MVKLFYEGKVDKPKLQQYATHLSCYTTMSIRMSYSPATTMRKSARSRPLVLGE